VKAPSIEGVGTSGIAVSANGRVMAVVNSDRCTVTVFRLPCGEELRRFGGPGHDVGQLSFPRTACFTAEGNLLIADRNNNRVQEVSAVGEFIRVVGETVFDGRVMGVAANSEVIVACQTSNVGQIVVFESESGGVLRQFGCTGKSLGRVLSCSSVCLTIDGRRVIVTDQSNNRVAVFTIMGDFVHCVGQGILDWPNDACLSGLGEYVVASRTANCVVVFSPDGRSQVARFGAKGGVDGKFLSLSAIAVARGRVYAVDSQSARVQVFE
jgi:DNA-binding beta-propeller fold protein YncE